MEQAKNLKNLKGKELNKFLVNKLNELADTICQDPDELSEFLKSWNGGFNNYSLNNLILALFQKPDFSLLAGYKAWKAKHNRQVKRGEKAIRILAPMIRKFKDKATGEEEVYISGFRTVNVFDVSQTEGDEINVGCSELVSGEFDFKTIEKACPHTIKVEDQGLANGCTNGEWIKVTPKENEASMVATTIHEWAHIDLGHCKDSGLLVETQDRSVKEVEAETVAFIVTELLGLENNKSRLYVGNWNGEGELKGRGKKILSVAERIVRNIQAVA